MRGVVHMIRKEVDLSGRYMKWIDHSRYDAMIMMAETVEMKLAEEGCVEVDVWYVENVRV